MVEHFGMQCFFLTLIATKANSFRCEEIIDIEIFTKHLHTLLEIALWNAPCFFAQG
jgi:hypothetical protein